MKYMNKIGSKLNKKVSKGKENTHKPAEVHI